MTWGQPSLLSSHPPRRRHQTALPAVGGSWPCCLLTLATSSLFSPWPRWETAWSRSSTSSPTCTASPTSRASGWPLTLPPQPARQPSRRPLDSTQTKCSLVYTLPALKLPPWHPAALDMSPWYLTNRLLAWQCHDHLHDHGRDTSKKITVSPTHQLVSCMLPWRTNPKCWNYFKQIKRFSGGCGDWLWLGCRMGPVSQGFVICV